MSAVISNVTTPFKRLKWGFIPQRRIIDEDEDGNFIDTDHDSTTKENSSEKNSSINIIEKDTSSDNQNSSSDDSSTTLEYRDESNRPWWKFFDEYEYRVKSSTKNSKKWYKWFHEDDTTEEKKLISKLDIILTFYGLMIYFVRYLSQTNLVNAYVGGMKEDLKMFGNELIDTQVVFNIGNVIFQLIFSFIIYAYPLNYVLPGLDVCWSVLTIVTAEVNNVASLKAIRFWIGAAESPFYVSYHYLLASWYRGSTGEIARRAGCFYFGQFLGVLTSGLIAGAVERAFGGIYGSSWRWIFRIDGIISLVVGIIGFYSIPGTPSDCYSIFLSDEDIRAARRRMKRDNVDPRPRTDVYKHFFDKSVWISIFTSWHFYVLTIWCILLWSNANGPSGAYALWLKSLKNDDGTPRFGAGQLQDYTALTPALGLVWLILTCSFADLLSSRWGAVIFSQVLNVICNLLLAIWNIPEGAKWFAWCLQYTSWSASPVMYSFQGDICRMDSRKRSVLLVLMNTIAQAFNIWISKLIWPTVEAPRYLKGFTTTTAISFSLILWTLVVLYFYKKQERSNALKNGIYLINSDKEKNVDHVDKT
ncbi:hypothetical protein KGF54_002359 [Candida jiufengensis]|uniref:uncharacterized protein n=1 Tax=Candida jiufengensis TaxID=497108 RepID=UPI00222549C1|nr:uncharacterized protein KGF54_002359 [Candida jiufengensis]KAI5954584.1 hypothetical protein KGF54_002359 [Candida jiufengensis]